MARIHLTELAIRKLPFTDQGQMKLWDTLTPGFGVIIGKRTKTYVTMFGETRQVRTIGRFGEISLARAREEAKRLQLAKPHKNAVTRLPELSTAFLDDCRTRLRPSSVQRYEDVLKKAPDLKLEDVTRSLAKTAHEIKAYKAMFNFAQREDLYDKNPFQHLTAAYGQRHRVLTDDEMKKVWAYEAPPFSSIIKLLILTGQRRNQIWKLRPEWVGNCVLEFPATIMKQGEAHTIPYGLLTAEYLSPPYSFNGWSKSKERMDRETGVTGWRIHDLRRTFATKHAELGTPIHVVEALLAHTSGQISGVTAVYNRYNYMKEMREAVQVYENFLSSLLHTDAV